MSVVAMESQCMKTVMKHLVDKSNFILSYHKNTLKIVAVIPAELAESDDCDFSCT